ncbi:MULTISPECIES: winged helix-turn-helix transcriptional regulator [Methanobrevibacter]|mgnify:FL=1|jgi:DNA-binding HxlR family transcriptional regulator|uniref:Putative HTH-type transcriptional regulator YybR n=1 Tax=Methanobrevibacter thaueri TaxID=190975 RepID=A0A315XP12_9EURY|nr:MULTISPECIES: helix-turn-helix domain-containing protein [Methanobrevibacter]MBR2665619.1 helix-turn-helix transcriptional regulator [Methanobrevibacter sp.]MBR3197593.1 helix-turn-helix transcriptional regulator [Methanobrevibacter sp.]MBR6927577.1 helix-turn-helix transcriptional regulator [Methanobrevibacter sp.]MBR7050878.1 helix-turn-helix transcriptional regulator [Methanobrevibacter sp.]PWB85587.1 putative HTH-type transcriptional regulator YybR [Methanobrevibacter thaueri]
MKITKHIKTCPIELVVDLFRKKWVIHIIRDLFYGKTRFNEFKEGKPELSNKVLSNCLKDMEDNGLIHRVVDKFDKRDIRYKLTDKGKSLNKVLYEIAMLTVESGNYSDKLKDELKISFRENLL